MPYFKKLPNVYTRIILLLVCLSNLALNAQIRLNEAVNSNSQFEDEDGDTPDWFELRNLGSEQNLAGWTLSDDADKPQKWTITGLVIPAGGYQMIWASGKDLALLELTDSAPHTNFKLSAGGETLYLHDDRGRFVDSLVVAGAPANVSVGIPPSGGEPVLYGVTTPGARNPETGFTGVVEGEVSFSQVNGVSEAFTLTLGGDDGGKEIRYTTDATLPVVNSPRYTGPIRVDTNVVVRARLFEPGKLPSPPQTRTYLVDVVHDIDVVTLVTEPDNFFDGKDGIYVLGDGYVGDFPFQGSNIWLDKEVPINFTLIPDDGSELFSQEVGAKIFGGYNRGRSQRSLSLFARNRYGDDDMDYAFFPNRSYREYKNLVLRNSGNDWMRTMLRDATLTELMDGSGLDVQAFRPVATYLNGHYWGLYNLREKVNEDFLSSRHGVDPDKVDLLEIWGRIVEGSNEKYWELLEFIDTNDLREDENYRQVSELFDVDNLIKFHLAQIYFNNRDWYNNVKFWREQAPGGKWRWILYDTDQGGSLSGGGGGPQVDDLGSAMNVDGPNPAWATILLRKLMVNQVFRERFINQLADEMNSRFLFDNVNRLITKNEQHIANEMIQAARRWQTEDRVRGSTERMRNFFRLRPDYVKQHVQNYFGLRAVHEAKIIIGDTTEGYVQLNSLTLEEREWTGDYYAGVPIKLTAIARQGYVFSHWELDADATTASITVDLDSDAAFRPVFRSAGTSVGAARGMSGLTTVRDLTYFPNPASSVARLAFTTLRGTRVRAQLCDVRGVAVRTFVDQDLPAGRNTFEVDVSQLPAGTYQLQITEDEVRSGVISWIIQ
ncbi:CotH kinase family protein [Neolewinella antarctica]|uniref:LTD domain-containing protein n=1 Tax=Neolewinella antarctica TaxID=442734 RepID=A0ABX0XEC4_9BACT|nr:CotH kinase family protein [Neolewinella antarctica]NJC27567.1 hypothetical protein [Neolewinella antarctica]